MCIHEYDYHYHMSTTTTCVHVPHVCIYEYDYHYHMSASTSTTHKCASPPDQGSGGIAWCCMCCMWYSVVLHAGWHQGSAGIGVIKEARRWYNRRLRFDCYRLLP